MWINHAPFSSTSFEDLKVVLLNMRPSVRNVAMMSDVSRDESRGALSSRNYPKGKRLKKAEQPIGYRKRQRTVTPSVAILGEGDEDNEDDVDDESSNSESHTANDENQMSQDRLEDHHTPKIAADKPGFDAKLCERTRHPFPPQPSLLVSDFVSTPSLAQASKLAYQPPLGFEQTLRDGPTNMTEKLFHPSRLDGKELWHIMAPASVQICNVSAATLSEIREGDVIISQAGVDYELKPEGRLSVSLMVPHNGGSEYTASKNYRRLFTPHIPLIKSTTVSTEVARTCISKRVSHLSNSISSSGSHAASVDTIAKVKTTPRQPSGLRTRFWPAGFDSDLTEISPVHLELDKHRE